MNSVEYGSLSLYTMEQRIKNIWKGLINVYKFFVALVYEESRATAIREGFDSRAIPPPRKGGSTEREICEAPSSVAIFSYTKPQVHSSIYWFKYKRDRYTIEFLSRALADEIISMISDKLYNRHNINDWIITYAPSTSFHRGDKKWDHNEDIFEEIKKNLDFNFQKIFGCESKEIKSSKKLSKLERKNNKFLLLPDVKIPPNSGLIIFDDVTTTGSTLKNLEKLAHELKPKIILTVAIAH